MMAPEMEKTSVTEIRVRMDCNGCVQKIKKALHGVAGIYDLYVDFPQQKVNVIGWADPVKIVKAIKKTRKTAVICSHTEQSDEASQPEPEPEPESEPEQGGGAPTPMPESTEQPQMEAVPPAEGQTEEAPPSQPSSPPSEAASNDNRNQSTQHYKPQNVEEIHVIYYHPRDYGSGYTYSHYPQHGNGGVQWNGYPNGPPQPIQMTQSYNTYKASPHVTDYAYPGQMQPSPPPPPSHYGVPEKYSRVYYSGAHIRGEPPQPSQPQPIHYYNRNNPYSSGAEIRGETPQPPQPQPIYYYNRNSAYSGGAEIRGETPQPPQTVHYYGGQGNAHPSSSQIRTEPSQPSQTIHYDSGNNGTSNGGQWNAYPRDPHIRGEPSQPPQPIHTTQSYNTYMTSPYTTEYAQHPQPPQGYSRYNTPDNYNHVYYNGNNGNISSMFSEENPNACIIA